MRKILQVVDGISVRPVEGADSMARFLRVVRESEINQAEAVGDFSADPKSQAQMYLQFHTGMMDPSTLPSFMSITPGVSLAVQPPIGTTGSHEEILASLSAANNRLPKDLQVSWDELKDIGGVSDTIKLTGEPHPDTYNPATDPVNTNPVATPFKVKEGDLNQPAVTPIKVPPVPQLPAQDGDQGDGSRLTTNQDGTKTYAGAFGRFTYNAQGKAISYAEPKFTGLGRSIDLTTGQTTQNYNAGPLNTTQTTDAKGNVVSHNAEYDLGVGKMAMGRDAKGITSKSWQGRGEEAQDIVSNKDLYAMGNKDKEATYDRAMAQVKNAPVQEGIDKFLSIVRKNDVSILNEGSNPHKVALPVQMAMQHYQQAESSTTSKTPSLLKKYFHEVESEMNEQAQAKRQVVNQYASVIAERVLKKRSKKKILNEGELEVLRPANKSDDYDSVRFRINGKPVEPGSEEFDYYYKLVFKKDPPEKSDPFVDTLKGMMSKDHGSMGTDPYKDSENDVQDGDVIIPAHEKGHWVKISDIVEAPIEMDPSEPNNPTIHGHQKANTMSLKNRIASARAQLQELAELSESNSLLAWEEICKKAKGGMFMGLEQNLEQIRHGISELAKQRRKGGVASRGIDKHIGEGKRK